MAIQKVCTTCWNTPCTCGMIYKDIPTEKILSTLVGLQSILTDRENVCNFVINDTTVTELINGKSQTEDITMQAFVESITSERELWPIEFLKLFEGGNYSTVKELFDYISDPDCRIRGKSILWILLWSKMYKDEDTLWLTYITYLIPCLLRTMFSGKLIPEEQCEQLIKFTATSIDKRYVDVTKYITELTNLCDKHFARWYFAMKEICLCDITFVGDIIRAFTVILNVLSDVTEPFTLESYIDLQSFDVFAIEEAENQLMEVFCNFETTTD